MDFSDPFSMFFWLGIIKLAINIQKPRAPLLLLFPLKKKDPLPHLLE